MMLLHRGNPVFQPFMPALLSSLLSHQLTHMATGNILGPLGQETAKPVHVHNWGFQVLPVSCTFRARAFVSISQRVLSPM